MLKKIDRQHNLLGSSGFVQDVGNENKGYMIPKSLHSVHVWGEYIYNGDTDCKNNGTKTANCTKNGCDAQNTVADDSHPVTEHTFSE